MQNNNASCSQFANWPHTVFITGIGTDVGKSYATGWLARMMRMKNINVITQKLIQTGNHGMSEDIEVHRRVMGIDLQPVDLDGTTAPIILSYPASPHLAAAIDSVTLDYTIADRSTEVLHDSYDKVLIEGAGGVMVPLTEDMLTIDYIKSRELPVVVVVNGQLGSINHAILTLEALKNRNIEVVAVIYNPYFDTDKIISDENRRYLCRYVHDNHPKAIWLLMDSNLL